MRSQPADRAFVESLTCDLVQRWALAWNEHDMELASTLVARDVDFVTVGGSWLRGRSEFLDHHRALHSRQMRESTWTNLGYQCKPCNGTLAVVQLEWGIQGDRNPDDTPRRPRLGHFTWVIAFDRAAEILAAQNTNLGPAVEHRLAVRGNKESA